MISGHVQVQTDLCSQTRNNIDSVAGRRADERSQITSTYAETVGKLIHIMGDLERLTSGKRNFRKIDSAEIFFVKSILMKNFTIMIDRAAKR